ncbi:MAG TPA: UDP-N-acetylmuramate dehydrogenase [Geobacteraceae bacterium]
MARPFEEICKELRGESREREMLAGHTSLKVGGPADLFALPADRDDLIRLIDNLRTRNIPYLVLGGGYNLLVRDGGFRGVVISLARMAAIAETDAGLVRVEAGATNGALERFCSEHRFTGLEFVVGIPGTVGGSLAVNAGAHGEALLDRVENLEMLREGIPTVAPREALRYGYRHLDLLPGEIILGASFRLARGEAAVIEDRVRGFLAHRRQAQRVGFPNAGSFFKNPAGEQAWRLIDAAGMRGVSVGGAQVAEAHANFLVNRGGATARDFLELAALVKEKVRETSGIILEEEVRIVGEA